jgi:hypothetical protein
MQCFSDDLQVSLMTIDRKVCCGQVHPVSVTIMLSIRLLRSHIPRTFRTHTSASSSNNFKASIRPDVLHC